VIREYVILDVFTDTPLTGNALAVFLDGAGLSDSLMQRAARELNLSETIFLLPGPSDADARVRIFTPAAELPFAGHPVLGAAFVVGSRWRQDLVRLQTGAGLVPVALRRAGGAVVFGEMEQPLPSREPFERLQELLAALRVSDSGLPVQAYRNGPLHIYVELADAAAVAALSPDLAALASVGASTVSCFARVDDLVFKSRVFCPALGVPEDPATGSAAGPLAVHLARHGRIRYGERIEIRQGAEIGRPSVLHAAAEGDDSALMRVVVGGAAVEVARGEYRLAP
jgi:trans-2,3-dihydro-3-hydroxyanthranilate isomerase